MPKHEDIEQTQVRISTPDGADYPFVTLCSCGKAFWDMSSQRAYDLWADHEADES